MLETCLMLVCNVVAMGDKFIEVGVALACCIFKKGDQAYRYRGGGLGEGNAVSEEGVPGVHFNSAKEDDVARIENVEVCC